jgi:hypothetical protein
MNAVLSSPLNQNELLQSLYFKIETLECRVDNTESELREVKAELADVKASNQDTIELLASSLKRISIIEEEAADLKASTREQAELTALSIKRTRRIENAIFKVDEEGDFVQDNEGKPVLSLPAACCAPPVTVEHFELPPTSKTEVRADLLREDVRKSGKSFYNNSEIVTFLKSRLPESCMIDASVLNIRKIKQDVLRAAKRMFSDVEINKSKNGRRETRLIVRS